MATQGSYNGHERRATQEKSHRTGEGRSTREYRSRDSRGSNEFRGNGESRGGEYRSNRGAGENRSGQNHGEYKKRENNRNFRNNDGKSGYKPRDNRNSYGGYNSYAKDKDDDDGRKVYRSSKPKAAEKVKEPQPDKFETIKRLEREQKTIKKKESKRNKEEGARPQQRVKRQNNRNILNDYANGMYDDYEDYDY